MPKRMRSAFALLRGQMTDWLFSPRTIIIGLVVLAMAYMNARGFGGTMATYSLSAHSAEAMFVYLSRAFGNVTSISAFFLIMVSEIPRRTPVQLSMLIRSNKIKWLRSQILFCFVIVSLMMILLTSLSMALTIPYLTPGSGWSMTSSNPELTYVPDFVPDYIRAISPFQANLFSIAILFAFWFTMVLVILLFSLAGKPNIGLIVYVFILMLSVTLLWEKLPPWMRVLPTHFSTLSSIAIMYPEHELQAVLKVLSAYAAVDATMIGLMIVITKKMDMQFTRKDKTA